MFGRLKEKANKIACNPKVHGAVVKVTNGVSAVAASTVAVGGAALTASAEMTGGNSIGDMLSTADMLSNVTSGYQPFMAPAIALLGTVGGIRLGWRFLRSGMH